MLIVDEISDTGETLLMVKERAKSLGASVTKSAVLYAHSSGVDVPDYIGLVTDALVLNPWDREILRDGTFRFHPEYAEALKRQDIAVTPQMLIRATEFQLAKD